MKYLVTYDLVGTDETSADYKRLIERLKKYPNWGKAQKSVWLIRSGDDATAIRNELGRYMDGNDRLLVIRVTNGSAWKNLMCTNDWMQSFMAS